MYTMKKATLFILTFLVFISIGSFAQEKVTLRLQLKKNDSYRVTIPLDMPTRVNIKVDEEKMKSLFGDAAVSDKSGEDTPKEENVDMNMAMELAMIFKVIAVENNSYKLEAYYEYMETSAEANGEKGGYSTKEKNQQLTKEQEEEFKAVKSVVGKKFNITISNTGELKEITGYDKVVSSLGKKKGGDMFGAQESLLVQQLDESEISTTIRGIFDVLPEKPVIVGDTWTKEYNIEDEMAPYKIQTTYTLKEINADTYKIFSESTLSSDKKAKSIAKVSGNGTGDILLSKTDHFQQTQPYKLNMIMEMEMLGMIMKTTSVGVGTYKIEKL